MVTTSSRALVVMVPPVTFSLSDDQFQDTGAASNEFNHIFVGRLWDIDVIDGQDVVSWTQTYIVCRAPFQDAAEDTWTLAWQRKAISRSPSRHLHSPDTTLLVRGGGWWRLGQVEPTSTTPTTRAPFGWCIPLPEHCARELPLVHWFSKNSISHYTSPGSAQAGTWDISDCLSSCQTALLSGCYEKMSSSSKCSRGVKARPHFWHSLATVAFPSWCHSLS